MNAPGKEHEYAHALKEDVYYPEHAPRTESATFRETKRAGHAAKLPCAVSGVTDEVEYHHVFIEEAFMNAVDWRLVKEVATGQRKYLPVLDVSNDTPTAAFWPVEQSLLWVVIQLTKARGFDWEAFDPAKPETFVDSMANMLVLHKKFHRGPQHGVHAESMPVWNFQLWPRMPGFIYSPDELKAIHKGAANADTD